jgi:hypothetical protein
MLFVVKNPKITPTPPQFMAGILGNKINCMYLL